MWNKVPKNEYHKGKPGSKKDPFKKDVILDPEGQWAHPGEVTKIPSGDITMQGVPYPVLGIDNLGNEQMMYPGVDYTFPGNVVTEYPQFQKGGDYNMLGYAMHHPIGALKHFINPEKYHATDEYKRPNHMTFSDESKYSNKEHQGGHWEQQQDGTWTFTPTAWNIQNAGGYDKLQDWWSQTEGKAGNILLPPSDSPQLKYGGDLSIPELNQAKKGGWLNKYSKMPKKKSSKNIKTSINKLMTRNPLFDRNYMLYGAKGPRLYDPNSKYQDGGVIINSEDDYKKSLIMSNKSPERLAAEKAWATKKIQNQQALAKTYAPDKYGANTQPVFTSEGLANPQIPSRLVANYKGVQQNINNKEKAKLEYQNNVKKAIDEFGFGHSVKDYVPENVKQAAIAEKGEVHYCISGVCNTLNQSGDPLTYYSGNALQKDILSGKLQGWNIEQQTKNIEGGDIIQFLNTTTKGTKGGPYHNALVIPGTVVNNEDGTISFDTYQALGGHEWMGFKSYTIDPKTDREIDKTNGKYIQLIKKDFSPSKEELDQRSKLEKEIKTYDPQAFNPQKTVRSNTIAPGLTGGQFFLNDSFANKNKISWNEYDADYRTQGKDVFKNQPNSWLAHSSSTGNVYVPQVLEQSKLPQIVEKANDASYKKKMMDKYNLSNKEYNAMVRASIGIYGQETGFNYALEKPGETFQKGKEAVASLQSDYSAGPFQVNLKWLNESDKKDFNIDYNTVEDPLTGFDASMIFLAKNMPTLRNTAKEGKRAAINQDNYYDFVPYLYNQQSSLRRTDAEAKKQGKTPLRNPNAPDADNEYILNINRYADAVLGFIPETTKPVTIAASKYTGPMPKAVNNRRAFAMGGWLDQYQGGGARKPIYVSSPLDPRYQAYTDSLSLYNNYKKRVDTKGGILRDTFAIDDVHFTPGAIYNEKDKIKPTGIEWHEGGYGGSGDTFIPAYKKPVQPVVLKKVVKKTPEQQARQAKPIESKLTPMEVAPEPALYKAPAPTPKYAYMPTNFGQTYYYEWDTQQNKWVPISQQSYNYNTESGTKNTQLYDSKPPGFKKGGWLDSYQDGGVTINSEEEYQKSLLMKNKTKERMDAERAWAAKKVAAANQAKRQASAPSAQQLFGIQPVAAESTGVNKTPQAGLDYKNEVAQSFHKAVDAKMKEKPNLTREQAQTQVNAENTYAQGRGKGQGTIRQADPEQGLVSKTIEVASHPFNALDAYVQSGYVPDYFSHNKDAVNPMDIAYSFTPAGWYTTGADALYNKLPTDVEQGNWAGVGTDILMGLPLGIKATQLGRTYIPQTYKINPWAFKPNPENFYRMVDNPRAAGLETGTIDAGGYWNKGTQLDIRSAQSAPKGSLREFHGYQGPYMIEKPNTNNMEEWLDFRAHDPNLHFYRNTENVPLNQTKVYKEDWLRGYKPVNTPTQLPGSPNTIFKSEIDWAKWNPETPNYPELINEYNSIEQQTKANGTWMKNSDGSPFQGTPEQFVQQNSANYKKAFPKGHNQSYRGVGPTNSDPDFSKGFIEGDKAIFAADSNLANRYAWGLTGEAPILTPNDPLGKSGKFDLMHPKGKTIDIDAMHSDWTDLNLKDGSSKLNLELSLKQAEDNVKRIEGWEKGFATDNALKDAKARVDRLKKSLEDYDKIETSPEALKELRSEFPGRPVTDDIAKWLPNTDINSIKLRNTIDGSLGDVTIINNKFGKYAKSAIGNVGFFDMTNPNIYKTVLPPFLMYHLLQQPSVEKKKTGGWLNKYQGGGAAAGSKSLKKVSKPSPKVAPVAPPNYTYNWSPSPGAPTTPTVPQVVMTHPGIKQHDFVAEGKRIEAINAAIKQREDAAYDRQVASSGPVLGALKYYVNRTEDWAEGAEDTKYYYKDPETNQMTSYASPGAYEQVGVPLETLAYGEFPLFEGAALIASPIKKGLSKAIAPSVEYLTSKTPFKGFKFTPKQLPGSPNAVQSLEEQMMSLNAPKGNMYGQNQVLTQQSRLLHPSTKAKYFKYQAPLVEPKITTDIFGNKFWKAPKDYRNRITPENYEEFINDIHSSTGYGPSAEYGWQPGNLGSGDYGLRGNVFSDAPLNNLGKDIINAHEKNHGMFAGTMSKEMSDDLLKPFGTKKPIPGYGAKQQADEVLTRMGQFKNAVGMGDDQVFTLGHLNLIRKNYANSFLDNGITEMLAKIKPGSIGEKLFLINMNKYAFGIAPIAIGAAAIPAAINSRKAFKKGGSPRKSSKKLVNYSQNHNFVKTQSNSWLDKYK